MSTATDEERLRSVQAALAPGTDLRDGLERILRGNTGALIVLGHDRGVEALCTGGFPLNITFSATRLRELAKMDGAIVLDREVTTIVRAATQLVPDPSIDTSESGTRHRTAERVAKQTGYPVITVSQSMRIIALYYGHGRHVLKDSAQLVSNANQALQTLERYSAHLSDVTAHLSAAEIEDQVTLRDVAVVLQRLEMVRRISHEVLAYIVELGTDGRLLALQLDEISATVEGDLDAILRDYLPVAEGSPNMADALRNLAALNDAELLDPSNCANALGLGISEGLDGGLSPRGYRLLGQIPRLPGTIVDRLVQHFGTLQGLLSATTEDLMQVDGVGEGRARSTREGMSRLAEFSADRYRFPRPGR